MTRIIDLFQLLTSSQGVNYIDSKNYNEDKLPAKIEMMKESNNNWFTIRTSSVDR